MDPITPASAPIADSTVQTEHETNTAPVMTPAPDLPERFVPEPLPFMPASPIDFYTPPPSPSQPGVFIYYWPTPVYSPFFVLTPEQFQLNTGQRMPGISYGSDALWLEGFEARRQAAERGR